MAKGRKITAEEIVTVKTLAAQGTKIYDIVPLVQRDSRSIQKIIHGDYDHLLDVVEPEEAKTDGSVIDKLDEIAEILSVIEERLGVLITNG